MNWDTIESRWDDFKASAKLRWGKLSVAQINGAQGKRENLARHVQEEYSVTPEEAERQLAEWLARQPQNPTPAARI